MVKLLLPILLLTEVFNTGETLLLEKPKDTEAVVGQLTFLNCSSDLNHTAVQWLHGKEYVYGGRILYSPYKDKFQMEVHQTRGIYNLIIPTVTSEDAGLYTCTDEEGAGESSSAELVVIEKNAVYYSNIKPDGVIVENDCNIDPDEVHLSCHVTYHGNILPKLAWVGINSITVASSKYTVVSNGVVCNATIKAEPNLNNTLIECQTTKSVTQQHVLCKSEIIKTLSFKIEKPIETLVNSKITCLPKTTLQCNYRWQLSSEVLSSNRSLTATKPGFHQCQAKCYIREKQCILFYFVKVDLQETVGLPISTVIVLVIFSVLFPCLLVSILLIKVFLTRRKSTKRRKSEEIKLMEKNTFDVSIGKPVLCRTVLPKASEKDKGNKGVCGIAIIDDELFVLSGGCSEIEVFGDLNAFERRRHLPLEQNRTCHCDMKSCVDKENLNWLLIVSQTECSGFSTEIMKISSENSAIQNKWPTGCGVGRISVTAKNVSIVFAALNENIIKEYSLNGALIREFRLSEQNGVLHPRQAVRLSDEKFVLCHGDPPDSTHRICIVNANGKLQQKFGGKKGSGKNALHVPVNMVVDAGEKNVLVADKYNQRVLILTKELKFKKKLIRKETFSRHNPCRLCLDDKNRLLIIACNRYENTKFFDGKVLVFRFQNYTEVRDGATRNQRE